jgi:hypothetical protein
VNLSQLAEFVLNLPAEVLSGADPGPSAAPPGARPGDGGGRGADAPGGDVVSATLGTASALAGTSLAAATQAANGQPPLAGEAPLPGAPQAQPAAPAVQPPQAQPLQAQPPQQQQQPETPQRAYEPGVAPGVAHVVSAMAGELVMVRVPPMPRAPVAFAQPGGGELAPPGGARGEGLAPSGVHQVALERAADALPTPPPPAPAAAQPGPATRLDVLPVYGAFAPSAPARRSGARADEDDERERRAPGGASWAAAREARILAAAARAGLVLRPAASPCYDYVDERGRFWALLAPLDDGLAEARRALAHLVGTARVLFDTSGLEAWTAQRVVRELEAGRDERVLAIDARRAPPTR